MTLNNYVVGVVTLALVVGSWAFVGRRVVRALANQWPVELRLLGASLVALGGVIVTSQLVGTIGLFHRLALVIVSVAVAGGVALALTDRSADDAAPPPWRSWGVPAKLALGGASVAVAQWSIGAWEALRHGIADVDSVAYHLPQAAHFVQEHSTTSLRYAGANAGTPYYPANSELLHAVGMVTLRSDVLSTVLTLAFLPLGMLAAFCIGKRLGSGPASLVGFSVLALAPILATGIGGSGYNDFTAIAFLLAAIAFALRIDDDQHATVAVALVGLGAGLALGTKLTLVPPVGGLTLTMWWLLRRKPALLATYTGGVVVGGAYWYVRNLVHVGNPLPSLDLGVFRKVPMTLVDRLSPAVVDYLGQRDFWLDFAPDALTRFFGRAWPLILLLVAYGIGAWFLALRRENRPDRAALFGITLTIAASVAAYVVMPTSAGDANGRPFLFVYNLRYVLPAFIPAFVLLPAAPQLRTRQTAVAAAGLVLVAAALASRPYVEMRAVLVAAALVAVVVAAASLPRAVVGYAAVGALAVTVLAGLPVIRSYERGRYADTTTPRARLFAWGRIAPADARVALVGLALQYPFLGPHLETRVEYLGEFRAHHEYTNYSTCGAWRRALEDGDYDFVIAEPPNRVDLPPAAEWTSSLPGARPVLQTAAGLVLDIRRVTSWPAC